MKTIFDGTAPARGSLRSPSTRGAAPSVVVGVSGASRNASVSACVDGQLVGACELERVTRVRNVGLERGQLPREVLDVVLSLGGARGGVDAVDEFVTGEDALQLPADAPVRRFEHHFAHAVTAFRLSPFSSAAVVICDTHPAAHTSVWRGDPQLRKVEWPQGSVGLARLYSDGARVFGFGEGQEHELEALARLNGSMDERLFDHVIRYVDGAIWTANDWQTVLDAKLAQGAQDNLAHRARVAGAFQRHLGRLLLAMIVDIRQRVPERHLCLGGGLFYNTFFNTVASQSGAFDDVFVAPNPGNAGLAAGIALEASETPHAGAVISPFLGPGYDPEEVKRTLDNCKLTYELLTETDIITVAVEALRRDRLVGWFQGRMEWGHRGLGNRSILASPLSRFVLDNLNIFLKHRARHRSYGFSVAEAEAQKWFDGPATSRFMEFDFSPRDRETLRYAIPEGVTRLRVQTVPSDATWSPRFHALHQAFGDATSVPILVNTSFNAFSEPIVCSPRDAVRVFFGTGLDMLIIDRFVVRK